MKNETGHLTETAGIKIRQSVDHFHDLLLPLILDTFDTERLKEQNSFLYLKARRRMKERALPIRPFLAMLENGNSFILLLV